MAEKRKVLMWSIIGIIAAILIVIGISYAYWQMILKQESNNTVTSGCFNIAFQDQNPISLEKSYPLLDEEGMRLEPYSFTITNLCESWANYQINLETLVQEAGIKVLSEEYLKVNLVEAGLSRVTTKLLSEMEVKPVLQNATKSYNLFNGILKSNESKTYNLRLWMHSDVTSNDVDSMNASYNGKVSVIFGFEENPFRESGTLKAYEADTLFWEYHDAITKVVFEDSLSPKEVSEEFKFDVSDSQDGSVMGYLVQNDGEDTYTLYLQSKGGVKANSKSNSLFQGFSKLRNIEGMQYFDTSQVTNMANMFYGCSSLTSLDLSNFNTTKVENMENVFWDCSSLESLDLSHFDTSQVNSMRSMFQGCTNLTDLNIRSFNTSNVSTITQMFYGCSSLTSLDLSNFDTHNVTRMEGVFWNCSNLTSMDLSNFDTRQVTSMGAMFWNCSNLTSLDLSGFDTSNVNYFAGAYGMFGNCTSLTTINYGDNFIYKEGAILGRMFYKCPANRPSHESWNNLDLEA